MPTSGRGSRRGRIFPHQRDADFTGEVLGEDLTLEDNHVEQVQEVEQFSLDENTKKNHRNRIKHIYNYWEQHFPDYYRVGVRNLTDEEMNDSTSFFWKNTKDIVYEGLNSKFLKAFVASKTKKNKRKNLKLRSHTEIF